MLKAPGSRVPLVSSLWGEPVVFEAWLKLCGIPCILTIKEHEIKASEVFFNEQLLQKFHVNHIHSALNKVDGLVNRCRHLFSTEVRLLIYNSLFFFSN